MKSNPLTATVGPMEVRGWIVCAGLAATAAVGIWTVTSALINGPAARAMVERQNAEEIARENRTFCTKFGMAPNTSAFRTCADDLAQIRQRQEDRWKRDFEMF